MHPKYRYTFNVQWSEEDNEYVGTCTEFPSLSCLELYPSKALDGITQLVVDCLRDAEELGEETIF